MSNFDTARDALETSMNSEGSALEEHEKYTESIEYKLNSLKASWQSFAQTFMESDTLKGGISALTGLVDILEKLIDNFGLLGTISFGVAGKGLWNYFRGAKEAKATLNDVVDAIRETSNITKEASAVSVNSDNAEAIASEQAANAEMQEVNANQASAQAEITETTANTTSATSEMAENTANIASTESELAEIAANGASTASEVAETTANEAATISELAEATANKASTATETEEAASNTISAQAEIKESVANVTSTTTEAAEATANLSSATTEAAESAVSAAGGFKKFASSLGGKLAIAGIAIGVISSLVQAYKNYREEQAALRQEAIETADAFLDSASSFEQAYIKYSGKTDLTVEEEAELESAIKGTVDALGDKSSALQGVVNSSNDYVAALERIKDAELEAAKKAAEDKRRNAEQSLREDAMGWETIDGSEVDAYIFQGSNPDSNDLVKIAKKVGGKFYNLSKQSVMGNGSVDTAQFVLSADATTDEILEYYDTLLRYRKELEKTYTSEELVSDIALSATYNSVNDAINKLSKSLEAYTESSYQFIKANYQIQNGIPKTTEEYLKMRNAILNDKDIKNQSFSVKQMIANDLDSDLGQAFDLSSVEARARKFYRIIENFGDGSIDGSNEIGTVETFLNMQTALNNEECTVGEYLSEFDNITSMAEKFSEEEREAFNLEFGLDTDKIKEQYDSMYDYLMRTKGLESGVSEFLDFERNKVLEIEDFLNNLTADELAAVVNIRTEIDWEKTSMEEVLKIIEEEAEFLRAMEFTIGMDVETEGVDAFNAAMAESVSATGLTSESIAALKSRYADLESEGYILSSMFEETSNGIHLNRKAVKELEKAYASNKLSETNDKLDVLKKRYDKLTNEINKCTDAGDRAALYTEQQSVIDKINDLATLASQYKGLTSAYNEWISAEDAGQERDMYENIIEGFETVDDEISRGWIDDGTIEFLELLTGRTDLAGKSGKELKKIYDNLDKTIGNSGYSVRDFFTVDDEGNSTNTGVYNFLETIKSFENELGDVIKTKDGKIIGFDFEVAAKKDENGNVIQGGDEVVAEALDISEELVQIMVRAADDAGFVVNLEGAYTQLADLKTEAENARDTLISLQEKGFEKLQGVDVNFNFSAEGNDLVVEHEKAVKLLDKFKKDGKVDLTMTGAQQALDIAEYLTIKLDDLTEPKYMQIDATKVEENLQDPIEKMQEFGDLVKEKHLVTLTGDTKDIEETEEKMKKVAKEIEGLDAEIKAKVGIDDGWSADEIADKLEKGEIEIPAEVKLDVQMSDDLKDMRLMMMHQLGLVGDNEVKLKVGFDIDESIVDGLTEEQQEVVIKYITENEEEFNKLTEDEQEILITYIAENEEEFKNLSEDDKEVLVEYIADGGDIEEFDAELEKKKSVKVIAETFGTTSVEELSKALEGVDNTKVQAIAEALGKKDVDALNDAIDGMEDNEAIALAHALGYENVQALKTAITDMKGNEVDATVNTEGQVDKVNTLQSEIDGLHGKNVFINIIKTVFEKAASGGKKKASQRTGADPDGKGTVNGTANVNGTIGRAFKQGSWGTKNSGTALVGELGREVLVRDGQYYTIGDNGAEFIKYKKGDIIFNHVQSEQLFRNGKVTAGGGRAKALFGGTAFAEGTAFAGGSGGIGGIVKTVGNAVGKIVDKAKNAIDKASKSKSNKTTSKTKAESSDSIGSHSNGKDANDSGLGKVEGNKVDSDSDKEKDKFEETIDFIEIAISRIEREIDNLDQKVNNVYTSWSSRNKALTDEISKVGEEITKQNQGYDRYIQEANSVGLSKTWAERVKNGTIDIYDENDFDEDTAKKIKEYREWYEKALDCEDAIEELKERESELYAQCFEHIQARYDGILQGYEHTESMLNEYINQAEEQGHLVSKKYYKALINNEKQNVEQLKNEQAALIAERDRAVADGKITKGSEAWYEQCAAIDEVTQSIEEGTSALIEYNNSIRDIDWQKFDLIQERISDITAESEFLIELMSNKDLFDDDGKLTEQGAATMGLHAQNYNVAMYQSDDYGKEIAKLDKQIAKDPYDQELINRRRELIEAQRDSILAAEDEKNAIKDLVEEGINLELDALQEKIDKKNEELEAEKDLYDYQRQVLEQTEEIASLEKQMASYSNDDSEEAKAKIQELKVSLEEAKVDLQETEWDRYIDQQSQLLTSLYDEYELLLNQRLDDTNYLLSQVIDGVNATALALGEEGTITNALSVEGAIASAVVDAVSEQGGIHKILNKEVTAVGTKLSTAMNTIWNAEGAGNKVITKYGDGFQLQQTTTNEALGNIKSDVDAMAKKLGAKAQEKINEPETQSPTVSDPTKGTNGNKGNKGNDGGKKPSSGGDGKPRVGDRVKFVNGQYYYDSQGKKPLGSHNRGKYVYITKISDYSWSTHPIHISTGKKLGTGDLGWLKKEQISEYATGKKKISNNEYAWTQEKGQEFIVRPSDGAILTPIARKDSVLNAKASNNIWDMANNPTDFIKNNLGLDNTNVPNGANVNNSVTQHFENINFNMPNVHSYNELISEMQRDPKFEKLILAMTLDQVAGKSKLTKNKAIR